MPGARSLSWLRFSELNLTTGAQKNPIRWNNCILVDKGFSISKQATALEGVVNQAPMANIDQFTPGEVEASFTVSALCIRVERWVGMCWNC